jgi:hypothetical protein
MILMAVAVASCDDTQPCSTCPAVEGIWFLQYLAPTFPCDGGTPPAPAGMVQIMREGSVLHSALDGIALGGTLYDTNVLTLSGQMLGGGELVSMRALYVAGSRPDAGNDRLLEGRLTRESSGCSEERQFTGAKF